MLGGFVIAFIDDTLIYSPPLETHVKHVKWVHAHLLDNKLYVKMCNAFVDHILLWVYLTPQRSLRPTKWPTPKTVKEHEQLLSFTSFYQRFI